MYAYTYIYIYPAAALVELVDEHDEAACEVVLRLRECRHPLDQNLPPPYCQKWRVLIRFHKWRVLITYEDSPPLTFFYK